MFTVGNSYNFTTLAPTILGASYSNMKVIGIVTMSEAVRYSDVVTKHESVKTIIPGLPNTPNTLLFVVFEDSAGDKLVIAQDYVDLTTIVLVTTINLTIQVFNVASSMEPIVRQRLKELGIVNFTVVVS